jgi:hypothetical protein
MSKITNYSSRPIRLPTDHIVPAMGELVTTNSVLNCVDNAPMISALAKSGVVAVEFDPEAVGADEPEETKVLEPTEAVVKVADTLELLADSAYPPAPKPPRVPKPSAKADEPSKTPRQPGADGETPSPV